MKSQTLKLCILLSLIFVFYSFKYDTRYKRYEVKSGVVTYTYSGSASGSRTLYFDNYGMKEALFDSMRVEFNGFKQSKTKLTLRNDFKICHVNLCTNQGVERESPDIKNLEKANYKEFELYKLSEKILESEGAIRLDDEKVNGFDCKVWLAHDTKSYLWKGIPLKIETNVMGVKMCLMFKSIEIEKELSQMVFDLPNNIKINNLEESAISF